MARDNPFWCDDCGQPTEHITSLFERAEEGEYWPYVTWCPSCGKLQHDTGENWGSATPRQSKHNVWEIAELAHKALMTDGAHHKQYFLERILEKAAGEGETGWVVYYDEYGPWERGIPP